MEELARDPQTAAHHPGARAGSEDLRDDPEKARGARRRIFPAGLRRHGWLFGVVPLLALLAAQCTTGSLAVSKRLSSPLQCCPSQT